MEVTGGWACVWVELGQVQMGTALAFLVPSSGCWVS